MNKELELDRLVSKWAFRQPSAINGEFKCEPHHYYSRRHHLLRWDIKNIVPVTRLQHQWIHEGKILYKTPYKNYLESMKNKDFKQWLIDHNMIEDDFLDMKLKEWRKRLDD